MPDRILVIEDDEATRYSYERALLRAGYRVHGYPSYSGAADDIDRGLGMLLIVDLQLVPSTPNGLAIARMARRHRPALPIIFVTRHPELSAFIDAKMGPIFLKPLDLDVLIATVRDGLN
jgi:DNA-binding NtrC family response regulator